MHCVVIDIEPTLRAHRSQLHTQHILIAQGALTSTGALLNNALPDGRWHLVADARTWAQAGPALVAQLTTANRPYTCHVFAEDHVAPTAENAHALQAAFGKSSAALAVGAGTINDLVKMASHRAGIPYAVVATAPSMNGYTSAIAALLENGVKTTLPCTPPAAVLADIDLLAAAPYRMLTAGFGDLLSKPVSQADWLLAHHLADAPYASQAAQLIEASAALIEDIGPALSRREPQAVGQLMGSLLLSGFSMAVAGTSAPSSGGEHLISHYLDMTHYAWGQPNDLHGCQVGVATRTTAALYEGLLALNPAHIDCANRAATHLTWATYRRAIAARFGDLTPAILPHAERGYPDPDQLHHRLQRLKDRWETLTCALRSTLRPAAQIAAQLESAQAPKTFDQLGVTPGRARRAILHSKDIRARYTILHLLDELGVLQPWTDRALHRHALLW